jgi:hypothetical protein
MPTYRRMRWKSSRPEPAGHVSPSHRGSLRQSLVVLLTVHRKSSDNGLSTSLSLFHVLFFPCRPWDSHLICGIHSRNDLTLHCTFSFSEKKK